jgi:hypothetical protein
MEMIGICQHHLSISLGQLLRRNPFNRSRRANGHETGGFNGAMGSMENSRSGLGMGTICLTMIGKIHGINQQLIS